MAAVDLYGALKAQGYEDLPDQATFSKTMAASPEARKQLYITLKNEGFSDLPEFSVFNSALAAKPAAEPMSIEGFTENVAKGFSDIGSGILNLPGAVANLPSAIKHLQVGAFGNIPGVQIRSDISPEQAAQVKRDIAATRAAGSELAKTAANVATTSFAATQPGELGKYGRDKILRFAYEHPLDIGMLAAAPVSKGLATGAEALRAAEAARIAAGGAGLLTKGTGALAALAETGAKLAPWINPMKPYEEAFKLGAKGIRGTGRLIRNTIDPTTTEINRLLGPYRQSIIDYLKPTNVEPLTGEVGPIAKESVTAPLGLAATEEAQQLGEPLTSLAKKYDDLATQRGLATKGALQKSQQPTSTKGVAPVENVTETGTSAGAPEIPVKYPAGEGYEDVFSPYRTAGEVAAGSGVGGRIYAAIQDVVKEFTPQATRSFMALQEKRNALRQSILGAQARAPERLAQMSEEAAQKGGVPYDIARGADRPIDLKPVDDTISNLIRQNANNRPVRSMLESLRSNIADGVDRATGMSDPTRVASMIDELKETMSDRSNSFAKKQLTNIKQSFYKQFPEYAAADKSYQAIWAPVHRAQIASYLQGVLVDANGVVHPDKLASAFNDMAGTIKKATGQGIFKTFGPIYEGKEGELGRLFSVGNDAASEMRFKAAASDPEAVRIAKTIYTPEHISIPGFIDPRVSTARWFMKNTQGKWTAKQAEKFFNELLQPETAIPALEKAIRNEQIERRTGEAVKSAIEKGTSLPAGVMYRGASDSYSKGGLARKYGLQ